MGRVSETFLATKVIAHYYGCMDIRMHVWMHVWIYVCNVPAAHASKRWRRVSSSSVSRREGGRPTADAWSCRRRRYCCCCCYCCCCSCSCSCLLPICYIQGAESIVDGTAATVGLRPDRSDGSVGERGSLLDNDRMSSSA